MTDRRPPLPPNMTPLRPGGARPGAPLPQRRPGSIPAGQPQRPAPYEKPKGKPMAPALRWAIVMVLGVAGIVGLAAVGLVLFPPIDLIRTHVQNQVRARTGRDLVIAGPASLTFFPRVGVTLEKVSLSPPPGMAGAPLADIGALNIRVATWPLLSRSVVVETIVLKNPVFDLKVDAKGRRSWDFAAVGQTAPVRVADAGGADVMNDAGFAPIVLAAADKPDDKPEVVATARHTLPAVISLQDVRIEGGTIRYSDDRNGKSQEIEDVDVTVALTSLAAPASAKGSLTWQGEPIEFDGAVASLKPLLDRGSTKLTLEAAAAPFAANYDGVISLDDALDFEGDLTASAPSARNLATWFETELPPAAGFGALSIKARIKTAGQTTTLSDAKFTLDGASAEGALSINRSGSRPAVQAKLDISELDLNKYMASADAALSPAPAKPKRKPAVAPAAPGAQSGDPIEQLLHKQDGKPSGPQVRGFAQRAGWSNTPINLSLLSIADIDAALTAGRVVYGRMALGKSVLNIGLKDRALKVDLTDVTLYGGKANGFVTVDGSATGMTTGADISIDGVDAQSFLKDAADIGWVSGRGNVVLRLAGRGPAQSNIVESLSGTASFQFNDGAISGFNVPAAIRDLSQGKLSGIKASASEKTDFSQLSASFKVTNGIADNQDLTLVSPLLRASGSGVIKLTEREVDYTVKPKIVASLQGQGGDAGGDGIEIPVRISGPWDKPKIAPDLGGVLANPDKAVNTIKELGKQLKGKSAGEIADDLLGKGEGKSDRAKDLLNQLFKKGGH